MKSHTDVDQSKILSKILSVGSVDMYWYRDPVTVEAVPRIMDYMQVPILQYMYYYPCWSLTALLNALPSHTLDSSDDHYFRIYCMGRYTEWYDNAIDACYEMILKLNELKNLRNYD